MNIFVFRGKVPSLFDEPVVKEIAAAHKKSPAQVLLRHAVQRDLIVLVKSVKPERIVSNFDVSFLINLTEVVFTTFQSLFALLNAHSNFDNR